MSRSAQIYAVIVLAVSLTAVDAWAHQDGSHEHAASQPAQSEQVAQRLNTQSPADAFKAFPNTVSVRSDGRYLFIDSTGLPEHNMMVGIRSWQQQVPLPQPYTGENAWRIPLHPELAAQPISAKTNLFNGAIAVAVNGVPIFNALNNRGEDAFLAGELDQWGGHCGRGDDYHYHSAPVHLEQTVGKGNPIAYALDGFPIYGYTEADGAPVGKLDELNGQFDQDGNYHYHATKTYPYINGGLRGKVTIRRGRIEPQPRDAPVRPLGEPLRGATITGFEKTGNEYSLQYSISGRTASITYTVNNDDSFDFVYRDASGTTRSETYRRRGRVSDVLPVREVDNRQPARVNSAADAVDEQSVTNTSRLIVSSSALEAGGELPIDFTCDGAGKSPPISWTKGPQGTECYALNFWHLPGPPRSDQPSGVKSYWLLYDIPKDVTSLPRGTSGIGMRGYNDKGRTEYDPVCSQGPGTKQYNITVYALSKKPEWKSTKITRAELLQTIGNATLAEGTLTFQYTRSRISGWMIVTGAIVAMVIVFIARIVWKRKQ